VSPSVAVSGGGGGELEPADGVGPAGSRLPAAAERGRVEVRQQAVERLVAAAAGEVDETAAPVSRVFGQALGSADLEGRPSAKASVSGDIVTAEVSVSVRWPAPLADVADRVRERVETRLADLAGMRVSHVDVRVTSLPLDRRSRRRVD
jgi:uncharacterized alkaline shock family protein YloU